MIRGMSNSPPCARALNTEEPDYGRSRWRRSGLEVLREIKANDETRAIPVVGMTSSGEERDVVESYKLGANSYIQKAVDCEQFRQTGKTLGLYWMEVSRLPPDKTFAS